jgi:hypothetical protein
MSVLLHVGYCTAVAFVHAISRRRHSQDRVNFRRLAANASSSARFRSPEPIDHHAARRNVLDYLRSRFPGRMLKGYVFSYLTSQHTSCS